MVEDIKQEREKYSEKVLHRVGETDGRREDRKRIKKARVRGKNEGMKESGEHEREDT